MTYDSLKARAREEEKSLIVSKKYPVIGVSPLRVESYKES